MPERETTARAADPSRRYLVNVVANYAGKLWSIVSIYLFVPFYIQALGISAYGLIAFYSVALAILHFADAGLSAAFSREAARETDRSRLLTLLVSTEAVLLFTLLVAGSAMALAAPFIASGWLNSAGSLPAGTAVDCVRLMPLALVPQIAMSLYNGGLMGQQRQIVANGLMSSFNAVRSGLVLLPLYFWPDPRTFFIWQAAVSWVFLWVIRSTLVRGMTPDNALRPGFSFNSLKSIAGYASGMLAMSIIAGLNTQLDRLIVSKLRPLDELAYYTLAATLAQIPSIVTIPIAAALLPRFTQLVSLYESSTYVVACVAGAAGMGIAFFSQDLLALWLHGRALPQDLPLVTAILSIGGVLLALQLVVFQLSLAHGHNLTNVVLGLAVLVVTIPMQIILTDRHGLVGAAVPWLVVNGMAFVLLGVLLNRRFHPGKLAVWFFRLSLLPLGGFALALWTAHRLARQVDAGVLATAAIGLTGMAAGAAALYLTRPSPPPTTPT